jgi:cytochrome oxidase assembly protein ShyY1
MWQIERANEKKLIIANYDKLLVSAPIALQKNQMLSNWQPIETIGTYEDTIVYEDNAINNGKAGFKVYHLFRNDDGTFIFIHRGFIERNLIKNNLPEVEIPTEKKLIYGTTLFKQNNTFVKNIEESDSRIIQEFNASLLIDKYPMLKDKYLHPFLFNLDIRDVNKYQPIEKPVNMTASKHIGYAIQWFGLCAALIILTIYAYRRKGE